MIWDLRVCMSSQYAQNLIVVNLLRSSSLYFQKINPISNYSYGDKKNYISWILYPCIQIQHERSLHFWKSVLQVSVSLGSIFLRTVKCIILLSPQLGSGAFFVISIVYCTKLKVAQIYNHLSKIANLGILWEMHFHKSGLEVGTKRFF